MNVKHTPNKIGELTDMVELKNVLYFHSRKVSTVVDYTLTKTQNASAACY